MKQDINLNHAQTVTKKAFMNCRTLNNQRNFYQHANFDQADAGALEWRKQNGMDGHTFFQ